MMGLINLNLLKQNLGKLETLGGLGKKRQARTSLLGLALDGPRVEAVLVRRSNGSVRVQNTTAGSLQLNLLTDDPELVGREIRNQLDRAGIRERYCAVCVPLEWALTAHTVIPDLPPEDVESFLSLEAERGFPFGQETLTTVVSRCQGPDGTQFATLVAIPKEHLATLQKVLKAAQLKPVSFSMALPALQDPAQPVGTGLAGLSVRENSVELQVASGGGLAAIRTLQGALEQDGVRKKPYADVVARDLRITLGQLPAPIRETVHRLKVFGHGEEIERFVGELGARAKLLGLEVELVRRYPDGGSPVAMPPDAGVSPALSLAGRLLGGQPAVLEFLPPKVSPWKQLAGRYSSRKLAWTGAAAGVAVFLVLAGFLIQQWQLSRWGSQWAGMKTRVTELENIQQQIRRFRPWFDDSFRSLTALQKLTEAFPEDGGVYAKSVEIQNPGLVTCRGIAVDPKALLKVVDQLGATKEFSSVQVDQIRQKQFTINLRWNDGGSQ